MIGCVNIFKYKTFCREEFTYDNGTKTGAAVLKGVSGAVRKGLKKNGQWHGTATYTTQVWTWLSLATRTSDCDDDATQESGGLHAVWPDWAIYWTLQQLICPKSPTFLGNFGKGVKIYIFSSEIILGLFIDIWWFFLVTLAICCKLCDEFNVRHCAFIISE